MIGQVIKSSVSTGLVLFENWPLKSYCPTHSLSVYEMLSLGGGNINSTLAGPREKCKWAIPMVHEGVLYRVIQGHTQIPF